MVGEAPSRARASDEVKRCLGHCHPNNGCAGKFC
jgi:hypothetical protein